MTQYPMKRRIIFATNNAHKLSEIRAIVGEEIEIVSLADIGCTDEIPETAETLEGNALQKAEYLYQKYGLSCFADDTGLEVEALNGAPGVHTARYAYADHNDPQANVDKLLSEMQEKTNRNARFRTAIALILKEEGTPRLFEGIVTGEIARERRGTEGFGYDPVFMPEGRGKTFAELGVEVKNEISHRARAVKKLVDFLRQL